MSLLPSRPPLTELGQLAIDIGVIGGVHKGRPAGAEFVAATLGTLPIVGVGLLAIMPAGVCINDDCVAIDEFELDLLGLTGRTAAAGEGEGARMEEEWGFTGEAAEAAVGVGTGDGWDDPETDIDKVG